MIGETDQEPENMEPDKNEKWIWAKWDDVDFPSPWFPPLKELRDANFSPFAKLGDANCAPAFVEGQLTKKLEHVD